MALPALLPFSLFILAPVGLAVWYSLHEFSGFGAVGDFVGLANYGEALYDGELWKALSRNLFLAGSNLVLSLFIGFVLAYFLYRKVRGWRILQVALFVPYVMPLAVTGLLWIFIFEPNEGLLNTLLGAVGLDGLQSLWLADEAMALPAATMVWVWRITPFVMLLLFSAMLRIPDEVMEAARVDGAREGSLMFRIVLPLIMPTVWLSSLLVLVTAFRSFDLMWILTRGGPSNSTRIATLYLYQQGFDFNNYGYANALAFFVALVIALPVVFITRRIKRSQV